MVRLSSRADCQPGCLGGCPRACLSERSRSTKGSARTACNSTSFRCSSVAASSSSLSCSRASEIRTTALATSSSAIGWAGGTASGTRNLRQSQGLLSRDVTGCATLQLGSSTLQALRPSSRADGAEQPAGRALAVVERGRHGSVLHQTTMGDPGRAPRSPGGVRNCVRGVAVSRAVVSTVSRGALWRLPSMARTAPDQKTSFLRRACGRAAAYSYRCLSGFIREALDGERPAPAGLSYFPHPER